MSTLHLSLRKNKNTPSILSIEFFEKEQKEIYIYSLTFDEDKIFDEHLLLKQKNELTVIYHRFIRNIKLKTLEEKYKKHTIIKNKGIPKYIGNIEIRYVKGVIQAFDDSHIIEENTLLSCFSNNSKKKENIPKYVKEFFNKIIIISEDSDTNYDPNFLGSNAYLFEKIDKFELGIDEIKLGKEKEAVDLPKSIDRNNYAIDEIVFLEEAIRISNDTKELQRLQTQNENDIIVFATPKFALKYINGKFKYFKVEYKMKQKTFKSNEVSSGTKQLIEYAKLVETPPENNYIYIIDEIETNLHRNLLKALISNFIDNNNELYKKNKGKNLGSQLIFTTHETSLMSNDDIIDDIIGKYSLLRLDEIFHVLKDNDLSSRIENFSYYEGIENIAKALESAYAGDYIETINRPNFDER